MLKFLRLFFDDVKPVASSWDAVHDFKVDQINPDGSFKDLESRTDESDKTDDKEDTKPDTEESSEESTETDKEESTEEVTTTEDETTESEEDSTSKETSETEDTKSEESEENIGVVKALKDTQRAYHEGQVKIKELQGRLEKLEKKPDEKPDELTLANIDPKVLQDSMAKDPVNTTRWIADQQAKFTFRQQQEAAQKVIAAEEQHKRVEVSEKVALKQFPILSRILALKESELATFKTTNPDQYEFAVKTMQYQETFEQRGDEEALYNAASRAYAELSPKALEKIKADITKAAVKAQQDKQTTVKQAGVSSGQATNTNRPIKKPSEAEFVKLSPQDQSDAMFADFTKRLANLKKK
jgi:hypothetical protein